MAVLGTLLAVFAALSGTILIIAVLTEGFETIILPRTVTRDFRFTRFFYKAFWQRWANWSERVPEDNREGYLSIFGPLSLLLLLAIWAITLVLAFALLQWAAGSHLDDTHRRTSFTSDLYFSGTTFCTLGLGDVTPTTRLARGLAVFEGSVGFGFLALVIGYLPVIYQGFSRRESQITMLDARASSPPSAGEMIRRHAQSGHLAELDPFLRVWESWTSDILESHLSYPVLAYYRSQHDRESWLTALIAMMDVCALLMVGVDGITSWQAEMTFAIGRHALVDLALTFHADPTDTAPNRLPPGDLARLRAIFAGAGAPLCDGREADERLTDLRRQYEPYAAALATRLLATMPPWFPRGATVDNWQTSAWDDDLQKTNHGHL